MVPRLLVEQSRYSCNKQLVAEEGGLGSWQWWRWWKGPDSGSDLKAQLAGLADGSDIGHEREGEESEVYSLNNREDKLPLTDMQDRSWVV